MSNDFQRLLEKFKLYWNVTFTAAKCKVTFQERWQLYKYTRLKFMYLYIVDGLNTSDISIR